MNYYIWRCEKFRTCALKFRLPCFVTVNRNRFHFVSFWSFCAIDVCFVFSVCISVHLLFIYDLWCLLVWCRLRFINFSLVQTCIVGFSLSFLIREFNSENFPLSSEDVNYVFWDLIDCFCFVFVFFQRIKWTVNICFFFTF